MKLTPSMGWLYWAVALVAVASQAVHADTVRQQYSHYSDNLGQGRDRWQLDLSFDFAHQNSSVEKSSLSMSLSRDMFRETAEEAENRSADSGSLNYGLTWGKTTDGRVMAAFTEDPATRSATGGIGVSQWIWRETLQLSLDASRTLVSRPYREVVGYDFDIIAPPALYQSTGVTMSLRHLATPRTIANYSVSQVMSNERPDAESYTADVRQFFPGARGAMRATVGRFVNRGRLTQATIFGQMDAWLAELGWQQEMWAGAAGKIRYRWYREDEDSRKAGEKFVLGTDMVTAQIQQQVSGNRKGQVPVVVEGAVSRYLTNEIDAKGTKVAATTFELGVAARL